MPFDKMEAVVSSSRAGKPASVTLSSYNGGKPRCTVGLRADFCALFEMKDTDTFDVLLGTGEHKGILRLRRNGKKALVKPRKARGDSYVFNLGYIERFGTEGEKKQYCEAAKIDLDTIEIVLPSWADEQDV